MKILFFLIFFLKIHFIFAQIQDNFDDGDFIQNPTWTGETANFIVDAGQLRLQAPNLATTTYLSTNNAFMDKTEWIFTIDLKFNPTATNFVRVYLASNQSNLKGNLQGYFIQFGQTNADFLQFFRQNNLVNTNIFTGTTTNFTGNVLVKMRVVRLAGGNWQFFMDKGITGNYTLEGTITDNTYTSTNFFGFFCQFNTLSNRDKYYFDDINIQQDNTPPSLISAQAIDNQSVVVNFSERLDNITSLNITNYSIAGLGNPTNVQQGTNANQVILQYPPNSFISGQTQTLTTQNLQDVFANVMNIQNTNFIYYLTFVPQYQELVFTEIMTDTRGNGTPLNPLPDAEYVEIFNPTNKIFNLKNVQFADESTTKLLPEILLFPNEYAVICDITKVSNFQSFGKIIGISSFPTLTNAGERILLKNPNNILITFVEYSDSWHDNSTKRDGGWSLEKLDVKNICKEQGNWVSSSASRGGTPAQANSQNQQLNDLTSPRLQRAEAFDNTSILLTFDENLEKNNLITNAIFSISPNLTIQNIAFVTEFNLAQIKITLNSNILPNQIYTISVQNIRDCSQNIIQGNNFATFGLAVIGEKGDIILNEILFDPAPNGSDFIEIFNNSEKYINLKNWRIANLENGILANQKQLSILDLSISPKSYAVFTPNTIFLESQYPLGKKDFYYPLDLPSYNDDEGNVILISPNAEIAEQFSYSEKYHFPLLDKVEGVSLERIASNLPANDRNSWQSGASVVGFATPAYRNSQNTNILQENGLLANPQVFTPNSDGNADFTLLELSPQIQSGILQYLAIFDKTGREIKRLADNFTLGTQTANFVWDGTTNQQARVDSGNYLVIAKVFGLDGIEKIYKTIVVLANRF
jgi:hypothetical protein